LNSNAIKMPIDHSITYNREIIGKCLKVIHSWLKFMKCLGVDLVFTDQFIVN
jgi:hypothetical protein